MNVNTKRLSRTIFMLIIMQLMMTLSAVTAWAQEATGNEITAIQLKEITVKSGAIEWVLFVEGAALILLVLLVINISTRERILSTLGFGRTTETETPPTEKQPEDIDSA